MKKNAQDMVIGDRVVEAMASIYLPILPIEHKYIVTDKITKS